MIVPYGGTEATCHTVACNCCTGGTTVYVTDPLSYSSNVPIREILPPEEELKALTRIIRRSETLAAQNFLAYLHDTEKPLDRSLPARYHQRPGSRRTCTATRNFRRSV